jgi:hypothetical protein
MNLGLDLPLDDVQYFDEDSEDSFGFEIGIDNANNRKGKNARQKIHHDDSDDSFGRNSSGNL